MELKRKRVFFWTIFIPLAMLAAFCDVVSGLFSWISDQCDKYERWVFDD